MGPPSGDQAGLIAGQFSCIDDGCQRPAGERELTGSFLDLRLIAARGNVCCLVGVIPMWGVAVKQIKRASACPTGRNRGSLPSAVPGLPASYSLVPKEKGERSIITSHLSFLQLQGNKQLVCEFDPHIPGWKKNLNFSASWWCIAVQMNRKIGRKVGR